MKSNSLLRIDFREISKWYIQMLNNESLIKLLQPDFRIRNTSKLLSQDLFWIQKFQSIFSVVHNIYNVLHDLLNFLCTGTISWFPQTGHDEFLYKYIRKHKNLNHKYLSAYQNLLILNSRICSRQFSRKMLVLIFYFVIVEVLVI